ncbi:MAG: MFS transporter [Planctomycetota bacterium]|nr:MFS transporter [Planctomycetota bacterium]
MMNLLRTPAGRRFLFAALYLSEGAPVGYVWWAMPTRLRNAGVPPEEVAALVSLLVLPWALKFLWAPLIDALRWKWWGLRAWIWSAQILMGVALLPLLGVDLGENYRIVAGFLIAHAFFAATQDVAVDAMTIQNVAVPERGAVNGWMQVGYLAGRAAFGGFALALEKHIGATNVILAMLCVIWATSILLLFAKPIDEKQKVGTLGERIRHFGGTLGRVLSLRSTWMGLAFAATAACAFESVGGMLGPLLVDHGATQEQIGWFYGIPVIGATVLGALIGGKVSDRFGRRRTVGSMLIGVAAAVAIIAALFWGALEVTKVHWAALTILYALIGAFTASTYAMFMDLTDPELGGTQFSAFMGATNLCEAWSIRATGAMIAGFGATDAEGEITRHGYSKAFLVMAGLSLLALPLTRLLPSSKRGEVSVAAEEE